eukprot:SAG31_NODE_8259_length_1487_cov_0.844380_3_plen_227_part_01
MIGASAYHLLECFVAAYADRGPDCARLGWNGARRVTAGLQALAWHPKQIEHTRRRLYGGGYGGESIGVCLPTACNAEDVKIFVGYYYFFLKCGGPLSKLLPSGVAPGRQAFDSSTPFFPSCLPEFSSVCAACCARRCNAPGPFRRTLLLTLLDTAPSAASCLVHGGERGRRGKSSKDFGGGAEQCNYAAAVGGTGHVWRAELSMATAATAAKVAARLLPKSEQQLRR